MPGAKSTRTRSPTLRRIPSTTVTVSSRSKSNTHGPTVSRRESASGPIIAPPERLLHHARLRVQVQPEGGLGLACRQAEVEVLRQLSGLLCRGHPAHQLTDSCPDGVHVVAAADPSSGPSVWLAHRYHSTPKRKLAPQRGAGTRVGCG